MTILLNLEDVVSKIIEGSGNIVILPMIVDIFSEDENNKAFSSIYSESQIPFEDEFAAEIIKTISIYKKIGFYSFPLISMFGSPMHCYSCKDIVLRNYLGNMGGAAVGVVDFAIRIAEQ